MAELFDPTTDTRTWQDIKDSCDIDDKQTINYLANQSFGFFFEHVLGYDTGCPVTQEAINFHQDPTSHKQTNDETDAIKTAVMAPRGHSKTVSWTMAPSLWRAFKEQGKNIIISSASRKQSTDILEDIKRIITRNEALEHLKPSPENMAMLGDNADIEDDERTWAAQTITTTTDVKIQTKTFGSSIRGKHVDYVFLDDILQDESGGTRSTEQEKNTFYNVVSPTVENKGGLLQIVGTPMSHDDLLMELMDKDNFHSTEYQAYYPGEDEVLWPEKWTMKGLEQKKAEIGPARFAREYMTDPMSVEEQYFDIKACIEPNLNAEHYKPKVSDEKYRSWEFVVGVDVALSDDRDSDYNVFTVIGNPPDHEESYIVDIIRQQTLSPEAIADELERLVKKYGITQGYYERNAQGEGLKHEVDDRPKIRNVVEPFDTTRKTRPEILSSLQAALYRQELKIVDREKLVNEMTGFRKNSKGKLEGKGHDDTVMSLAIAYRCIDSGFEGEVGMGIVSLDDAEGIDGRDTGIVTSADAPRDENEMNVGIV